MLIGDILTKICTEEKDPEKIMALGSLSEYVTECIESKTKIDGRKLFDMADNLIKKWPEFAVTMLACGVLGAYGNKAENIDISEPDSIMNIDINDVMNLE